MYDFFGVANTAQCLIVWRITEVLHKNSFTHETVMFMKSKSVFERIAETTQNDKNRTIYGVIKYLFLDIWVFFTVIPRDVLTTAEHSYSEV